MKDSLVLLLHGALGELRAEATAAKTELKVKTDDSLASDFAAPSSDSLADLTAATLVARVRWPAVAAVVYSLTGEIIFPDALQHLFTRDVLRAVTTEDLSSPASLSTLEEQHARLTKSSLPSPSLIASLPTLLCAAGSGTLSLAGGAPARSEAAAVRPRYSRTPVTAALAAHYDPASPLHARSTTPPAFPAGRGGGSEGSRGGDSAAEEERAANPAEGLWWSQCYAALRAPEERRRLHQLRCHTALSPEVLGQLLERFFIVDGADIFFNPLPLDTVMEFNQIRSESYRHIVRAPLCLMEIKQRILQSRRQYHYSLSASPPSLKRTRQELGSSARHASSATAAVPAPLGETSGEDRVLTLADLERDVWHIAANCVFFNAPESEFPPTARRFALACTSIIIDFCRSQQY